MNKEDQSKCMQLPVFDPADTDETFAAKVVALRKLPRRVDSPPAHEPMVYVQIGIPAKLYDAYHNSDSMEMMNKCLAEMEVQFRRLLISKYKGGKK
jgi:hypothetical protein